MARLNKPQSAYAGVSTSILQGFNDVQRNHHFLHNSPERVRIVSLLTRGHPGMNYLWFLLKQPVSAKCSLQCTQPKFTALGEGEGVRDHRPSWHQSCAEVSYSRKA